MQVYNDKISDAIEEIDNEAMRQGSNCGAEMPSGTEDDHGMNHILAGEPANGHVEARTTTVQVGSHTEDQGHYETKNTVDYRYCTGCGERQ